MRRGSGVFGSRKVQKAMFATLFGPKSRRSTVKSSIYYCNINRWIEISKILKVIRCALGFANTKLQVADGCF